MRHTDPDTLALLALGEDVAKDGDRQHIAECAECATELQKFNRAVGVGRSTLESSELLTPAPAVWERVSGVLGLAQEEQVRIDELAPRRRRWVPLVAAAASIALVGAAGLAIWQFMKPEQGDVIATATLESFPEWPDATGEAIVEEAADGSRVVRLDIIAPELEEEYGEVWLISSDATRLVSLGTVSGATSTLPIPAGIDLTIYDLVDVSAEPYDGDPNHSGNSIVRGQLS